MKFYARFLIWFDLLTPTWKLGPEIASKELSSAPTGSAGPTAASAASAGAAVASHIFDKVFGKSNLASIGSQYGYFGDCWQFVFNLFFVVLAYQGLNVVQRESLQLFYAQAGTRFVARFYRRRQCVLSYSLFL